ncbi:hypothetical protein ACFSX5_11235 [Devosia albogilva]|uniref:Prevent-host-death protein n=1 Tax=Devosia albogilva TaxID=429726 RepID=A0ABW5QKX0_9HYPH
MMQESSLNRAPAQRPIVIEVSGEPQGVVVPAEGGYRFVAVKLPAFAIDGQHFASVDLATAAVARALNDSEAAA